MCSVAGGRVKVYEIAAADHFSLLMLLHELNAPINMWFKAKLVAPAKD